MNTFERSFTFVFHDRLWLDKLIGGALCLILACFGVGIPYLAVYLKEFFLRIQSDA